MFGTSNSIVAMTPHPLLIEIVNLADLTREAPRQGDGHVVIRLAAMPSGYQNPTALLPVLIICSEVPR